MPGKETSLKYEMIERTNYDGGPSGCTIYGFCQSKKEGKKYLAVILNYRPACDAFVLESPGGMIDKGEDMETCALREFKEETGLTAQKVIKSVPLYSVCPAPWFSNDKGMVYTVSVDLDLEENKPENRKMSLDKDEDIRLELLEMGQRGELLLEKVIALADKEKCVISSIIGDLALGMYYSSRMQDLFE